MGKQNRIVFICLTIVLFLSCIAFGISFFFHTNVSATSLLIIGDIKDNYTLGETLEVPSAEITYEGHVYPARENVLLFFPSGSVYEGKNFALTEEGIYTVEYSAIVGGKTITDDTTTFSVTNVPYSVTGDSDWAYVNTLHTQSGADAARGGISVGLSMSGKFLYNKPIDISGATANSPILTFSPYQYSDFDQSANQCERSINDEVNRFYVRLTDAHNPDLYVDWCFVYRQDTSKKDGVVTGVSQYYRATAGASGQDLIGLDADVERLYYDFHLKQGLNNCRLVTVDGVEYAGEFVDYGAAFTGYIPKNLEKPNGGQFSIFFDPDTNRVYVESRIKNGSQTITKRVWLNDLDEIGIYGDNLFQGFTTGEVYLSVWAEDYVESKFRFEILDIYGTSFSDLNPETNVISDTRKPDMFYVDKLPSVLYAKVGEPVDIPKVVAYDVNLKEEASIAVFYYRGSQLEYSVSVENGQFKPRNTGEYTIVYFATDNFGNSKTMELKINVINENVITLDTAQISTTQSAGQWVVLPDYTLSSKNGKSSLKIYLIFGGESNEIDTSGSELKFFLDHVGQYTLKYVYSDALTTKTYSYNFNSVASDNITFDDFALPHYLIKKANYTIDAISAYEYKSQNPTAHTVDVYVKEDSGEYKKVTGKYKVNAETTAQFKYKYKSVEQESDPIPVVDVGFGSSLKMDKYFSITGSSTTAAASKDGITISNPSGGSEHVEFINAIPFSSFSFAFSLDAHDGSVDSVSFKLTDYYDPTKVMDVTLTSKGDAITFDVNGVSTIINKGLYKTDLEFFYNAAIGSFSEKSGKNLSVESPFTSNLVFFEFSVEGATSAFDIRVSKVGNQPVSNASRDYYAGTITYDNIYGGANTPGSTVTVYRAQGLDVLSPYCDENTTVSVRDMDNNYVVSVEGISLQAVTANRDYDFIVEKGKTYIVSYEFVDQNRQSQTSNYNIIVLSMDDPTITLEGGLDDRCTFKVKRGASVKVAGYEAKNADGTTAGITVYIYTVNPKNEMYQLEQDSFTASYAGEYTVLYYCLDEYGNFAMQSYTVIAE